MFNLVDHVRGNIGDVGPGTQIIHVVIRPFSDQVNDSTEIVFHTDGKLNGHRHDPEPLLHHAHRPMKIGSDSVHLVYIGNPRHTVLVGLSPYGLGLRFHPSDRTEDGYRSVQNSQTTLHLYRKVHVSGRVDNIDTMVSPMTRSGCRGDGDTTLFFLDHPVHRGRTFMYLAHLAHTTGVEQDALGRRSLTGVNMSHDAYVSCIFQR